MNPDDAAHDDDPTADEEPTGAEGTGSPGVPQVSDEEWAELVSRMMGDPGDDPREPLSWPSDEEAAEAPAPRDRPAAAPAVEPEGPDDPFAEFAAPLPAGLSAFPAQDGSGFRAGESSILDEPEEGYEPPEPPPIDLSASSPFLVLSWFCALAGPAYVLFVVLFWRQAPHYTVLIGVGAFIAGLIGLGMHLPTRHDDNDDGAVV